MHVCIVLVSIPISSSGNSIAYGIHAVACRTVSSSWAATNHGLIRCMIGTGATGISFGMAMSIDAQLGSNFAAPTLSIDAQLGSNFAAPTLTNVYGATVTLTHGADFTVEATGSAAATNIVMAKEALETARSSGTTFTATAILAEVQEAIDRPKIKALLGDFSAAVAAAVAAATVNVTVGEIVGSTCAFLTLLQQPHTAAPTAFDIDLPRVLRFLLFVLMLRLLRTPGLPDGVVGLNRYWRWLLAPILVVIMLCLLFPAPVGEWGATTAAAIASTIAATIEAAAPTNTSVNASTFSQVLDTSWIGSWIEPGPPPLQGVRAQQVIRWMTSHGSALVQCKSANGTNAAPKVEVTATMTMTMTLDISNMTNVTKKAAGKLCFRGGRSLATDHSEHGVHRPIHE